MYFFCHKNPILENPNSAYHTTIREPVIFYDFFNCKWICKMLCIKYLYNWILREREWTFAIPHIVICNMFSKLYQSDALLKEIIYGSAKHIIFMRAVMFNTKGKLDPNTVTHLKHHKKLMFIKRKSCCNYCRISRKLCIWNNIILQWKLSENFQIKEIMRQKCPKLVYPWNMLFHYTFGYLAKISGRKAVMHNI